MFKRNVYHTVFYTVVCKSQKMLKNNQTNNEKVSYVFLTDLINSFQKKIKKFEIFGMFFSNHNYH